MCGRIFSKPTKSLRLLMEAFGLTDIGAIPDRNNIAPTESIPVIHKSEVGYIISPMRWWLHPAWSPDPPNQKYAMFNARIESVLTSPAFRGPIRHQRAIVPIAGFVEWKQENGLKQPYYVEPANDEPLAIAAIWECWQEQVWSSAIITQPANVDFATIHDRMPLSLTVDQARRWLDPMEDAKHLVNELAGHSLQLSARPVNTAVNNARNKSEIVFV